MSDTGNEYTEAAREQLVALEQFLSDSFFKSKDKRSVLGSGEFVRGQVTLKVEKITDEDGDYYLVTMKNATGDELGFGLSEDKRILRCDDGKNYPVTDEQISLIKSLAASK